MKYPLRTKIICTLGPAVGSYEAISSLVRAGMNVARINFSHGTSEAHSETIALLKKAREELQVPLAIMLDTRGPEMRIGKLKAGAVALSAGQRWRLVKEQAAGDGEQAAITPASVLDDLQEGVTVLFDDGYISSHVVEKREEGVVVEIENSGTLESGKGVNIPCAKLSLPSLTEKDIADIKLGCELDVDYIAASFIRTPDDILVIKNLLSEMGKKEILVIAKIENSEGVENFDSIVQVADGIMIARGDLGVEVPLTQVPKLQKMMIRKSYMAGKPAITATQMLESMMTRLRPTRAETSDVANAIYDSTSAVMLSGETAVGNHPVEVVTTMCNIVEEAEQDFDYRTFFEHHAPLAYHDVPSAVTLATVKTAYSSNARAIFSFTSSGTTARLLGRLRPRMPIMAMTSNRKCYHQMALNWGVIPVLSDPVHSLEDAFSTLSAYALEKQYVKYGDLVILTGGSHFGISGTTNLMMVESIGDVLVRGDSGCGSSLHGKVTLVHTSEGTKSYQVKDKIVVITKCDESYLPLVREASGIILANHIDDLESETFAMQTARNLGKPAVVRADGALGILNEGQLVTIDPVKALVYKGVVL